MRIQRCKGTRDLSPGEMVKFRQIEAVFRECCLKWGYEEVRTPTLEYLHLFTSTGTLTSGMLGKVYSFLDWDGWSGERVVLRPDSTIPVARFYIENDNDVAKLFYVSNVFIFEGTGRETRERWQCGTELIGAGSTAADVELILMALEVLRGSGLEGVELKLSHAGLIRALLAKLGLSPEEQARLFDQMLDGDTQALARIKPEESERARALSLLLDMKGKSAGFLRNLRALFAQNLPEMERVLDDFTSIVELLDVSGCKYQIDIASGRGFEYYTGVIFQLFKGDEKVGGGGRYDALIPLMGGPDVPASGFALYVDHLMSLLKLETPDIAKGKGVMVRAEPGKPETLKESFELVKRLHEAGYVAEVYPGGKEPANLRWRLEVNSQEPRFVLIDRLSQKRFEAKTVAGILRILGVESASKDSAA